MSDSDIAAKGVLVKYMDNGDYYYMHKKANGSIEAEPTQTGALLFTPSQAKKFINVLIQQNFPFKCGPEVVK